MWPRRTVLKALAAGAGSLAAPFPLRLAFAEPEPDIVLSLTAAPDKVRIWSGPMTQVLRFTGKVERGRPDALKPSSGYLGPTLDLRRGERVRIHFVNRTQGPSIIHWHGMIVPEEADGHPRFAVGPGGEYSYEFTVQNPAGTYLYHPHPHGQTGAQVYYGLAGLLIVREPEELERGLPASEHELSFVIQDRRAGSDNQFVYTRTMMDEMDGVLGDEVLVNGIAEAAYTVTPRTYRLRLANVSNARIYKLAWSDSRPMRVIATDNGLLSSSEGVQTQPYVVLAPFQRVELLEDFGERRSKSEIALMSRSFSSLSMGHMMGGGMMGNMMGGMMSGMMGPDQGEELLIARFTIAAGARSRNDKVRLPELALKSEQPAAELHTQLAFPRMRGQLNGRRFEMTAVASDEHLPLRRNAVWTFSNDGPAMMSMPHPMHIHGVRFRILERRGGPVPSDLREGIVDAGYKDMFLIFPGERVRVALTATEPGMFMYHCHNLEHEDGGMMRNVLFEA